MNRVGEKGLNNFGSKMEIVVYRNANDIDVYFEEYNWVAKNKKYNAFKAKEITCPYEPRLYNIGYIGEGKYKRTVNGKNTNTYRVWKNMFTRCYSEKYHINKPEYKDCEVCEEWHNFQNFAEWYYENYYEIEGQIMCLDKDILFKGNKIYSPTYCIFVPHEINNLFTKSNSTRGEYLIGCSFHKASGKIRATCSVEGKGVCLGFFDDEFKAFEVYKNFKEKYIKEVADKYFNKIPRELWKTLYEYEVDMYD